MVHESLLLFNYPPAISEVFSIVLEAQGYKVFNGSSFHDGDLSQVTKDVRKYKPTIIMFRAEPPYDQCWKIIDHLRRRKALCAKKILITTTDKSRLKEAINGGNPLGVLEEPCDIDELASFVKRPSPVATSPQKGL